jgi:hypothetical protein
LLLLKLTGNGHRTTGFTYHCMELTATEIKLGQIPELLEVKEAVLKHFQNT